MEKTTGKAYDTILIEYYERSSDYWVGWILAHYQWYSGRTFKNILETISYEELSGLYGTLHEADIQKSYEVLDMHFADRESKLKTLRKSKDLNKAGFDIVMKLAKALKCDVEELYG